MEKELVLSDGVRINLIVPKTVKDKLWRSNFRATKKPMARKFIYWREVHEILDIESIYQSLLHDIRVFIAKLFKSGGDKSIVTSTIVTQMLVGWETSIAIDEVNENDYEFFHPNSHSLASSLKFKSFLAPAPLTKLVSFALDIKKEKSGRYAVIITSIYPGEGMGILHGDITRREKRVFFPPRFRGEKLPDNIKI